MRATSSKYKPISQEACLAFADTLEDNADNVVTKHFLQRGLTRIYMDGEPDNYKAAILQDIEDPTEPDGWGEDPKLIWELLKCVDGWDCIEVDTECGKPLGEIITRELGIGVHYVEGIGYELHKPVVELKDDNVRLMTLDDLELLEACEPALKGYGCYGTVKELLKQGFIASAIVEGKVLASAYTVAHSKRYAELGVQTLKEARGRGFGATTSSVVAKAVQKVGMIPVWGTGDNNPVSMRLAERLGFTETDRDIYVVLDKGE